MFYVEDIVSIGVIVGSPRLPEFHPAKEFFGGA
jgi:hypothetical protein